MIILNLKLIGNRVAQALSVWILIFVFTVSAEANYDCHISDTESSKQEGGSSSEMRSIGSDFTGIHITKKYKKWAFSKRKVVDGVKIKTDLSVIYQPSVVEKQKNGESKEIVSDSFEFNLNVSKVGSRTRDSATFRFFNSKKMPVEFLLKVNKKFDLGGDSPHQFGIICFTAKEKMRQKRNGTKF